MSSPNIAKKMHVGHLRSTMIGEALANLLISQGHSVTKINHIGDFGTQFGVLMAIIKERNIDVNSLEIGDLEELYRQAKQDPSPALKKKAQRYVLLLQSGDQETRTFWEQVKHVSKKDYEKIYDRLGVHSLIERGESFYLPHLSSVVDDLLSSSIAKKSNGAVCVFETSEKDGFPLMIRKSDGGFTYDTTDLAALRFRFNTEKVDRVIYVTDSGQAEHFKKVFAVAEKAGWMPPTSSCEFIGFGVVLGPDGKRFRTRLGNAMPLADLLDLATRKAAAVLAQRHFHSVDLTTDETAEAIGVSAVKFADLSRQRESNISFDMEKIVDLRGNTSSYLQYTLCRASKILAKAELKNKVNIREIVKDDFERELAVQILRFADVIDEAANRLEPHLLCQYLCGLASAMNSFYNNCPILQHEREQPRLLLLHRAAFTLQAGFQILGITVIHHM